VAPMPTSRDQLDRPQPLTLEEWQALLQRWHLALRQDRRGPGIRLGLYAERLQLVPRLIETVALLLAGEELSQAGGGS